MASRTLLRLNKAQIYYSYHGMQDRDADLALRQYKQKMKWGSKHKILDIGCGPGDLTVNYLLPLIPTNGQMVGVDISQAMIQYASSRYQDPRLKFEVLDISNPHVVGKYKQIFNSVFSFYCLHWVQDQWNTMKNIYDILDNGGEALLVFLASSPIFSLYERLASTKKWSPYMYDYKEVISPYHHSINPAQNVKNLLTDIGFVVNECNCKPTTYTMPNQEILFKSIQAVNPFLNRIPDNLLDEYNQDVQEEIINANLCMRNENSDSVSFTYSLITVYATKPTLGHNNM